MFEPKCDWWRKIKWEDKTVLLKGILSIKRKDYGRFVELALDAGMREALAGDYDEESQSGEFWFDAEKEGPIRSSCSWRTGTRRVQRTRASGATRSMARRCTSKMVASSSTRWQEGHPRGCPSPYGGVCVRYV